MINSPFPQAQYLYFYATYILLWYFFGRELKFELERGCHILSLSNNCQKPSCVNFLKDFLCNNEAIRDVKKQE